LLHFEEWGHGDPAIALHPLALESSAFSGIAQALAARGIRTLAADLPGFGQTPVDDDVRLTPAMMAEQVVELARSLEQPPLLIGYSMGGRVALEAALMEPDTFRGVVAAASFLPWKRARWAMEWMRHLDPRWAEGLRLEVAWPAIKRVTERIESIPQLEHDWLARAGVRCAYYLTCPATRVALLNAAREMCLDPGSGPESLWQRMPQLEIPTTFLWAGRDGLIPKHHWDLVSETIPWAGQLEVPCSGHFVSGAHFRCMRHAIALAVCQTLEAERGERNPRQRTLSPCLSDVVEFTEEVALASPDPAPDASLVAQGGSH
jgi:pimeloyl-ACP methyl ester carboxylesterase